MLNDREMIDTMTKCIKKIYDNVFVNIFP